MLNSSKNKVLTFYIIGIPNDSSEMNAIHIFKNYINMFYYKCYSNLKYVSWNKTKERQYDYLDIDWW